MNIYRQFIFIIIFQSLTTFVVTAQNVSKNEYYCFLNSIMRDDSSLILLSNKPSKEILDYIYIQSIMADSLFSIQDKDFFYTQMHKSKNFKWEQGLIKNTQIIKLHRSFRIIGFVRNKLGIKNNFWEKFHRKYGEESGYASYSIPVFTLDRKYCIIYLEWKGGWLKGGGGVNVYVRNGDNWDFFKSYSMWIS